MHTVLHVGAHKTGTSLVQWYVRDHLDQLQALGIRHVLRTEMKGLAGSGTIVEEHPDRLRRRLDEELAAGGVGVLASSEDVLGPPFVPGHTGLYPQARRFAEALRVACEGLDVRVVLYLRPVDEFVESYYVQTVQQGSTQAFEPWYDALDEAALSWEPMVEALDDVFGADRVALGDFREIRDGQDAFLRRFLVRARLPVPEEVSYDRVRNPSVSARGLEMARTINPLVRGRDENLAVRRFIQRNFSNRTEERARPMPDPVRARLRARRGEEYERLAERARSALAPGPGASS